MCVCVCAGRESRNSKLWLLFSALVLQREGKLATQYFLFDKVPMLKAYTVYMDSYFTLLCVSFSPITVELTHRE